MHDSGSFHEIGLEELQLQAPQIAELPASARSLSASSSMREQNISDDDEGAEDPSNSLSPSHHAISIAESDHDQLPDVEEYKASMSTSRSSTSCITNSRTRLKITLAVALGIVVASILIAVGVVIGRDTAEPKPEPYHIHDDDDFDYHNQNGGNNAALADRFDAIANLATVHGWADSGQLHTDGTPEHKACHWMAFTDGMQLPVDVTPEFQNRFLLALFYYSLNGEQWDEQMNFLTAKSVCHWNEVYTTKVNLPITVGVSCHGMETVREIFIPKNRLVGPFPSVLGFFTDLIDLNLFENEISGALPDSLQALQKMETLILHNNQIEGPIPDWITEFSDLQTLNLNHNQLTGALPEDFGEKLTNLQTVALEHNRLTGTLNPLQGLHQLKALYLGDNRFSDQLTDTVLVSLSELEIIDVSDNILVGNLPATLLSKDSLVLVDLHGNNFSGHLPDLVEVGDNIQFLALQENQLTGPIDERLLSLTALQHLDLSRNFFSGAFPDHLAQLTDLKYLFLAFNDGLQMSTIPPAFGELTNLVDLSLQKTNRIGTIPGELGELKELVLLDLQHNVLEGTIPYQLGRLSNLNFLLLKQNDLRGTIPPELGQLTELDTLLLDDNRLDGGSSGICGHIPRLNTFIADCSELGACDCCTRCCLDSDTTCNSVVWFSDLDPLASDDYRRDNYLFHETDIEYPADQMDSSDEEDNFYEDYNGYTRVVDTQPISQPGTGGQQQQPPTTDPPSTDGVDLDEDPPLHFFDGSEGGEIGEAPTPP